MIRSEHVESRNDLFITARYRKAGLSYRNAMPLLHNLILLTIIVYTSNLLFIITHEMGHAVMSSVTGGRVINVSIDYLTLSGKTTFLGGEGTLTAAGGIIAGSLLCIFLYRSGMWSARLAAAVIAFRTLSECILIMPGADVTFLKDTYIAPLVVAIVLVCGFIMYSGTLKGLGKQTDKACAVGVSLVSAGLCAIYLL